MLASRGAKLHTFVQYAFHLERNIALGGTYFRLAHLPYRPPPICGLAASAVSGLLVAMALLQAAIWGCGSKQSVGSGISSDPACRACQCPDMGDFVYPRHGCIQELMLKEAAWTAKFIRRQREEEAEERALQQQRSKWEQQAEESGAAAPLALLPRRFQRPNASLPLQLRDTPAPANEMRFLDLQS
eukprot:s972_g23.t1